MITDPEALKAMTAVTQKLHRGRQGHSRQLSSLQAIPAQHTHEQ